MKVLLASLAFIAVPVFAATSQSQFHVSLTIPPSCTVEHHDQKVTMSCNAKVPYNIQYSKKNGKEIITITY